MTLKSLNDLSIVEVYPRSYPRDEARAVHRELREWASRRSFTTWGVIGTVPVAFAFGLLVAWWLRS